MMNVEKVKDMELTDSDISSHYNKIYDLSMRHQPKLIVELGVSQSGNSSKIFSLVASETQAYVVGVDIVDCPYDFVYNGIFVRRDDIAFAKTFKTLVKQPIDILFIDTSHEYEHTKAEIDCWFPLLSNKAIVMFHDTNLNDKYVRENGTEGRGWDNKRGVMRAIEKYFYTRFDETERFQGEFQSGGQKWHIQHWPLCNGFTCLRRI